MRMMNGLDRTVLLHKDAQEEAEEARNRARILSRELAEFREVHSAMIDSMKAESDRHKEEAVRQRQAAEAARAEAEAARKDLETFKEVEADRHQNFLKSREFQEILGPKAFKFLKIDFQNCRGQFAEAGLLPPDTYPTIPDINKAIDAVSDNVLEDEPEAALTDPRPRARRDRGTEVKLGLLVFFIFSSYFVIMKIFNEVFWFNHGSLCTYAIIL